MSGDTSRETEGRLQVDSRLNQLPHLGTFAAAAERSSFTGAARALGLTQAAVSQRIQLLERTLNKSLFDRRGGRVVLTEAGKRLYDYALRIDDLHREARTAISGQQLPIAGELEIAASSVPGEHLLPALLSGFGRKYPHLRVRATVSDSLAVIGQVDRGEVSLGLVGQKVQQPHFVYRYLASDRIVLVVPPGHPLIAKKTITFNQLAQWPLLLRESGSGMRHCFETALDQAGGSLGGLQVTLELGSNEAIKEAVRRGVGVAVLSTSAVREEFQAGQLVTLPLKGIQCDRDMFVVQDQRRVLPVPARMLLNYLESNPVPMLAS
ncbi:MAG: selenium metabolism-associated LysR family transcriptional regulator [Gemmataceae bacterium]